jgi:hypothetical protein
MKTQWQVTAKVPAGPEWLHEIKDGFRLRVEATRPDPLKSGRANGWLNGELGQQK